VTGPRFALLIPTRDRAQALARTRARLPASWEVLVCDQSATPSPGVWHRPDLTGLPAARNALLSASTADIVVFCDDDTDVGAGFLAALERVTVRWPAACGWGPVLETRPRAVRRLHRLAQLGCFRDERRLTGARLDAPTTALFGACFAVRRVEALQVGFDDRRAGYALGEDLDFCRRLCAATGTTMRFCRDLPAIHREEAVNRADPQRRGHAKAAFLIWLARRHGRHNPATLFHLLLALAAAASGAGREPAAWRGVLAGLRAWLG
jgi:GT2 family glycosyltransferase